MVVLKRIIAVSMISIITSQYLNAGVKDFIQNSLNTSVLNEQAGYFKSQAGGLMTLGSGRIRFGGGGSFSPFNVQMPSLNVGCSGIDMIFGAFSYLDFDQIVEKLKKISTAAPAFAFKMALSTLCKDCDTIMTELEDIVNAINNMNFDTCEAMTNWSNKISDALSTNVSSGIQSDWLKGYGKNVSDSVGKFSDFIHGRDNQVDEDGSTVASKVFNQGSIVKKAVAKSKSKLKAIFGDDYEHILRALVGDIVGWSDMSQEPPSEEIRFIAPTLDAGTFASALWGKGDVNNNTSNDIDVTLIFMKWKIDSIKSGEKKGRYNEPIVESYDYKVKIEKTYSSVMLKRFDDIVGKIRNNTKLSNTEIEFLNAIPLPTLDLLYSSAINNHDVTPYLEVVVVETFNDLIKAFITNIQSEIALGGYGTKIDKDSMAIMYDNIKDLRTQLYKRVLEIRNSRQKQFETLEALKSFRTNGAVGSNVSKQ